jgi:hypothetical protein
MYEHTVWLHLSTVEREYMRRLQVQLRQRLPQAILNLLHAANDGEQPLTQMVIDRHTVSRVIEQVLELRKACVHPSLAAADHQAQQQFRSMHDVLQRLTDESMTQCREALREVRVRVCYRTCMGCAYR